MSCDTLTPDNNQFSRVTIHLPVPILNGAIAINCTDEPDATTLAYVAASIADSTRRAYLSDLEHFTAWGGVIPATDVQVASYLAAHAETLAVATLTRRLVSISLAHRATGHTSPTASELVRATMRGIRRTHGVAQAQATPLLRDDLFQVLDHMGDRLKDLRDRALLLIGFAGGFRCSEVVGLDHGDLQVVRQGMIIHVRRSKTDQEGHGRKIGIPFGRTRHCPIRALDAWKAASAINEGPVFRPVDRHGKLAVGRLSGDAVSSIVRERVNAAGFDATGYSGHSLRAGFATSAAQAGVSSWKIRSQTGHASDAMLARYVRDGEMFLDNAAGTLL
jgi:integrase